MQPKFYKKNIKSLVFLEVGLQVSALAPTLVPEKKQRPEIFVKCSEYFITLGIQLYSIIDSKSTPSSEKYTRIQDER